MARDRRVKYTKMILRESLIKLLLEKPIARVTVKELCEKADINRATFYTHYTDQFDLFKQIEAEFIADVNSYLDNFTLEQGETGLFQLIVKIFEYVEKNSELCRVLLGRNGDMDFQTHIMQIVGKRVFFEWGKRKKVDEIIAEYIYTYVATGSIGIIRKWLFEENQESPEKMAALVARLANKGIEAFIS
ncbi:MAG: TetR/AcrR family transcriptional regulator [Firmicutes bacterium]|nr:TetR/AcrR family transcriptional regulator [Bacillota bacterium]